MTPFCIFSKHNVQFKKICTLIKCGKWNAHEGLLISSALMLDSVGTNFHTVPDPQSHNFHVLSLLKKAFRQYGKDAIATVVPVAAQGVRGRWNPSDGTLMGGLPQYPLELFLIVPTPSHRPIPKLVTSEYILNKKVHGHSDNLQMNCELSWYIMKSCMIHYGS